MEGNARSVASTGSNQPAKRPSARMLGMVLAANILAMSGVMYGMISMNHASGKTAKLWTFWECTYFIVITATTIGLGDLVPQMHRKGKIVQFWLQFMLILLTWAIFAASIQANEAVLERKTESAISEVKKRASLGKMQPLGRIRRRSAADVESSKVRMPALVYRPPASLLRKQVVLSGKCINPI
jgi:hypothetical protein